jgi:hypothetical protein
MFGNGVAGAKPIAAKITCVDGRQTALRHVTQAPKGLLD